ncbi:MAG: hypothetical protein KTR29_18490 [Rhodothermaceae bacterium]|nr:hypothetical protein [Rhodothermaceae bacterium]
MARGRPSGHLLCYLFACFLGVCWTVEGFSQPLLTVPYSLEEGLVQSQVTEIYQDQQGFMWFGTLGGISRFDGLNFTNFTVAEGLASNRIMGIAEDQNNHIWIATPHGINVFDGTSFTLLTTKDGLLDNHVYDLKRLPSGDIWIASRSGLTLYNGRSFSHITEVDGLVSPIVLSLEIDGNGILWAGTTLGVCMVKEHEPTCYTVDEGLPHPVVRTLLADRRGRIWVGTSSGIALLLPGEENRQFITLDYLPNQPTAALLEDKNGAIWISNRSGFYRIDQQMDITDRWTKGEWIGSVLYQDREGSVWAGTYGRGAIQFRPTAFTNETHGLGLPEDVYLSVYEDANGVIWAGTLLKGLFRIKDNTVEQFDLNERPYLNHIRSIRHGPDGALWLASANGVIRYDASGFRHFSNKDGFRSSYTFSVLPDSNGVTWAGTHGGLYKIEEETVSRVAFSQGNATIHTLDRIDDRLWIGTEGGLMYMDQDSFFVEEAFPQTPVLSIGRDRSGKLWIGTMGSGVYLYDPISKSLTDSISTEDGLNSSTIYFTRLDANNNLWVGTSKGVNRVNLNLYPDSKTMGIKQFGQKDGIVGIETNKNAATIDHEGRLWFGTLKGLMKYDVAHKPINIHPPPVYLTNTQLFLEDLPQDDTRGRASMAFSHNENHLTFHFLGLSFISPEHLQYQYQLKGFDKGWSPLTKNRFATYSTLAAGNYTFEVRASNSDGVWSRQPASVSFTITPPYWQTNWFRGISAAGFLLLIIGIVQIRTFTIKKRSKQLQVMVKERTNELETTHQALLEAREDALQAARTRSAFLSNMTHELRTPMNGIMGMAELLKFTELDEEQADYSITILESSTAMLDMIENLLTFADLAAGRRTINEEVFEISHLIQDAISSLKTQIDTKKLEIFTYISPSLPSKIKADREHIRQITKHLLSNAVKFTEEGLIYIEVDKQAQRADNEVTEQLALSVHDSGIGIEPSKLKKIFDSFTQLDMTATRAFEGTGIGLTLARHMSTLLGGNLYAESKPGVGSSFYFSIPLHEIRNQLEEPPKRSSVLVGKKVMIVLQSERDQRRLALLCKSLGMAPELEQPSALLSTTEGFDLILSEIKTENATITWNDLSQLEDKPPEYSDEKIRGLVIEASTTGKKLESAIHKVFTESTPRQSSDFHKDFGNPMENG